MRRLFLLPLILLCGAWIAQIPASAPSYTGPGDVTAFTAWWSCTRAYSAAKAAAQANACDLVRASDSTTCTMKLGTDGNVDLTVGTPCTSNTQTVTQFCNSTTCTVSKAYDQTAGNACQTASCDAVQATGANQPVFNLSGGSNNKPYLSTNSSSQILTSANNIVGTNVSSFSVVANRVSGTVSAILVSQNSTNNWFRETNVANLWQLQGGSSGSINGTANDNTWQAANSVINGASSVVSISGTESTGTVTGSTTTAAPSWAAGNVSRIHEAGFKNGTGWTFGSSGTTVALLCANQAAFYGTPVGAVCS